MYFIYKQIYSDTESINNIYYISSIIFYARRINHINKSEVGIFIILMKFTYFVFKIQIVKLMVFFCMFTN